MSSKTSFESDWQNPPREFSMLPFWFWNDELNADELINQIAAFERNGIYGFVIHPRVGLPRDCGWMSDKLLGFYTVAIEEAAKRDMRVLLYDEGMYPSGSSCGQLVEQHPDLACRCLALHDVADALPPRSVIIQTFTDADGHTKNIVERPANSYIRGLHYLGTGDANGGDERSDQEDEPPAGDILNPRTAPAIIDLVYARFFEKFGKHFGKTILGIFTDEPNPLGKCREKKVFAAATNGISELSRLLGYDIAPLLPQLWAKGEAADRFRADYRRAIRLRMDETWYAPLSDWCASKGVALCGHPDTGDELGVQRYFQIPGQDLVWRWVLPDHKTALEGPEATQAKCSASAMVHHRRRRNSNEFAGAYGPETTFDEIRWLANWCLIRGVNLLIPHAFYYSVRGPRRDERPPQIGPHTPQWDTPEFKTWADHCRRMSWLNSDYTPVVNIAILAHDDRCPWPASKVLLQHQRDFHYLDFATLLEAGHIEGDAQQGYSLCVADMRYAAVVIDGSDLLPADVAARLTPLVASGAVIRFTDQPAEQLIAELDARTPPFLMVSPPSPALRIRIVKKAGRTLLMTFNESLQTSIDTNIRISNGKMAEITSFGDVGNVLIDRLRLPPGGTTLLQIT